MLRGYELLEDRSTPSGLFDVFQARAPGGQLVVLRRLRAPQVGDALLETLERAREVKHPAVAPILDVDEYGHAIYFTQPWYAGVALRGLIDFRRWTVPEAVGVLAPVLGGLAAAHALGVVHQEVSPENVFMTATGVVLADFGLAGIERLAGLPPRHVYVSPEQARGRTHGPTSDVFQAGLLLFELLTGRPAAMGPSGEVLGRVALGELDSPREAGVDDEAVARVLERALALAPAARFESAQAFAAALGALAPVPTTAQSRLSGVLLTSPWPAPTRDASR